MSHLTPTFLSGWNVADQHWRNALESPHHFDTVLSLP